MAKYRKLPTVVDAAQIIKGKKLPAGVRWVEPDRPEDVSNRGLLVKLSKRGVGYTEQWASYGDWVVTEAGERIVVGDEEFRAGYEVATA